MNRFLFLRDTSRKWVFMGEKTERSKDLIVNLMEKLGKRIKLIGGKKFYQELSFMEASMAKEGITILYPSCYSLKRISLRFRIFVEKEMGRHTLIIILLIFTLPFSAILGILPGPNVIFWTELFMLYIYFKAIKGLKALLKSAEFIPDETLGKWEMGEKDEESLRNLKERFSIENLELIKD